MYLTRFSKLLLALVAVVAAAYLLSAVMLTRQSVVHREAEALPGTKGATSIIRNFQHIESRLDQIAWELSASQAELLGDRANLTDIKMKFYTPEKEVIALSGRQGTIDLTSNNIEVKGDVVAVYNNSYYFFADQISWDSAKGLLTSPGPVRIVGPEGEIKGGTVLMARPDKKRFVIRGGVTVDFTGNLQGAENKGKD